MTLERVEVFLLEVHLATVIMPQTPAPIHLTSTMTAAATDTRRYQVKPHAID